MSKHWQKPLWCASLLLALVAEAAAQQQGDVDGVLYSAEPCDGTLWFRAAGAAVSDGSAQLGVFEGGPVLGLQWDALAWNNQHLWLTRNGPTLEVFGPGGGAIAPCLGVATLQGGFIVGPGGAPITEHLGAFAWDQNNLYAIEVFGGGITLAWQALAGIQGIAVLASRVEDLDAANPMHVVPNLIGSVLVYTAGHLYRVDVTMVGGGIALAAAVEVFDPAGNAIAARGVTVVNSAFQPPAAAGNPSTPQGAAFTWGPNNVFYYQHPAPAAVDFTAQVLSAGAAIPNSWGVMPLHFKSYPAAALPAAPVHKVIIWDPNDAHEATRSVAMAIPDDGGAPIASGVTLAANPLIKRQASFLYEHLASYVSGQAQGRGMVLGLNQRHP